MNNVISGLKMEHWYHLLIVLGAAGAFTSMTVEVHAVENAHALLVSLGVLAIGIGEWINHPLQVIQMPPSAYTPGLRRISGHPRQNRVIGILFDLLGFALAGFGVYRIVMT